MPSSAPTGPLPPSQARWWRHFVGLTGTLSLLTLTTMILGPYVRSEGAGLACPDWPLCFGHVIPPLSYQVYLEFTHRAVAGAMSLVFLGWLLVLALVRDIRRLLWRPALLALGLLVLQITLGGATITERLNAYVVKSHLLNALLYLSVIVYIWKRSRGVLHGCVDLAPLPIVLWGQRILVALIFFQIFLGGRLSANEAGLDCPEFPACYVRRVMTGDEARMESVYFPPLSEEPYERPMSHRLMACALLAFSLWLVARTRKTRLARRNALLFALVSVQILLGALNVKWGLPLIARLLHSTAAMALYLLALLNLLELRYHETQSD